jgi:hypothetical protein
MSRRDENSSAIAEMVHLRGQYMAEMSSFRSGFESRFGLGGRGSIGMGANASADSRLTPTEYYSSIEDSRTAHEKFGFVRGLTAQARIHRVQDGTTFDAQTPDPECNKFLNDYFSEWLDDEDRFDFSGERAWPQAQKDTEEAVIRDGDMIWLGLDSGHVQFIENHRIRSSNWVKGDASKGRTNGTTEHLGVVCDGALKRLGYRVTKSESRGPWATIKVDDLQLYQTRDFFGTRQVFHAYDAARFSLTRGVSAWATMIETTNMLDQGKFSLLVKSVLAASLAWVVTNAKGTGQVQFGDDDEALGRALKQKIQQINAGGVLNIQEGDKVELLGATIGAAEAIQLIDLLMQDLSLNLGIPLAVGILNGDKLGNFTSGRMTWDLAKIGIRATRQTRNKQIAFPMWRWKLRWLLAQPDSNPDAVKARRFRDKIAAGEFGERAFFWVRCQAKGWPYPQPLDDASANALSVSTYQNSLRRVHLERGDDLPTLAVEFAEDRSTILEEMVKAFEKLVKKYPETLKDFTLKDFMELGLYRGTPLPRTADEAGTAPPVAPAASAKGGK